LNPTAIRIPNSSPPDFHPVVFEGLNGQLIHGTALKTNGSAGPSGIDAAGMQRLCSSFQYASRDLCKALATVVWCICTSYVDPEGLSAFIASRPIALGKHPGVRPIGIGEVIRHIIGKVILTVVSDDIQMSAGSQQLCAGQRAGCEAAVHTMHEKCI
jgi:hypothetical protein